MISTANVRDDFVEMAIVGIVILFLCVLVIIVKVYLKYRTEKKLKQGGPLAGMDLMNVRKLSGLNELTDEEKAAIKRSIARQILEAEKLREEASQPLAVQLALMEQKAKEGDGLKETQIPEKLQPLMDMDDEQLVMMVGEEKLTPDEYKRIKKLKELL